MLLISILLLIGMVYTSIHVWSGMVYCMIRSLCVYCIIRGLCVCCMIRGLCVQMSMCLLYDQRPMCSDVYVFVV